MNKLDINTSPEQTPIIPQSMADQAPQSPVDEPMSVSHNQVSDTIPPSSTSEKKPMKKKKNTLFIVLAIVAVGAGITTGFGVHKLNAQSTPTSTGPSTNAGGDIQQVAGETVTVGEVFGVQDADTFKDSAEGYLIEGGAGDEGSHSLQRAGGESQTVVLTSSITDLDKFIGMEVKVWGETFKAQKAGWLMDVGRVEVINPEGEAPAEAE